MAILLQDQWFDLECGCEASQLGGLLVSSRCPAHRTLIPPEDLRVMTGKSGSYGTTYGPIDLPVHEHARGGDARRTNTGNIAPSTTGT